MLCFDQITQYTVDVVDGTDGNANIMYKINFLQGN